MVRSLPVPGDDEFDHLLRPADAILSTLLPVDPPSSPPPWQGLDADVPPRRGFRGGNRQRLTLTLVLLLVVGAFGALGSWAAWQVSDTNANNTFSTSTVLLQDNQGGQAGSATSTGSAMFNVTNLSPGSSATTACVGVNFSGAAASAMSLSAALGGADQSTLQSQLTVNAATYNTTGTVAITGGSNTNSGSCSNYPISGTNTTIGSQGATLAAWSSGGPYSIASPVTNTWYKFTVSGLPAGDTNCNTYCNRTITMTLTWTLTTV